MSIPHRIWCKSAQGLLSSDWTYKHQTEITIVIIKVNLFCKYLSRGQLKSHSGDKQILFYNNNNEHKVSCYQIQFIFEIRKVGGSYELVVWSACKCSSLFLVWSMFLKGLNVISSEYRLACPIPNSTLYQSIKVTSKVSLFTVTPVLQVHEFILYSLRFSQLKLHL